MTELKVKAITPSQQGDFDGACGFYAVINAISLIYPRVDRSALFHHITRGQAAYILRGTGRNQLNAILRRAEDFMSRKEGTPIAVERPFWKKQPDSLDSYWETLRNLEQERRVPIIGYEYKTHHAPKGKADAHWSVVKRVTPKNLILHDSDGIKRIPRQRSQRLREHSRRSVCLDTTATFVISRGH